MIGQAACSLCSPAEHYRETFLEGALEFLAENRLDSTYAPFLGFTVKALEKRFAAFVTALTGLADESTSAARYVDRVMWLVNGDEYIGQASIRPELSTKYLMTYGGHIGYSIRPSRRRRGYGTQILALSLEESRRMGLRRVLVTCNSDNAASKRIIESNGGLFENELEMDAMAFSAEGNKEDPRVAKLRYWIDLRPSGPIVPAHYSS